MPAATRRSRPLHYGDSPFHPARSAEPPLFVGREEPLEQILDLARRARHDGAAAGFLAGERGIGKTALARVARRALAFEGGRIVCRGSGGRAADLDRMTAALWRDLARRSPLRPYGPRVAAFFGDRLRPGEPPWLHPGLDPSDPLARAPAFAASVRRLLETARPDYRSLLLVLDHLDDLAAAPDFPRWIENTLDELSSADADFCLLLVGTEKQERQLRERLTAPRRLESIAVPPWSRGETCDFFRQSFADWRVSPRPDDLGTLADFSAGHPRLAHEIGAAVWRVAETPHLSARELARGVAVAADLIGLGLLERGVFRSLRDEPDRSLVQQVAEEASETAAAVRKRRRTAPKQRAYEALLRRLEAGGALTAAPEATGGYRFADRLHAGFLAMESRRTAAGTIRPSAFA